MFLIGISMVFYVFILESVGTISKKTVEEIVLTTKHAQSFLRKSEKASSTFADECCTETACAFEERAELAETSSWPEVHKDICEVSIREEKPCTCIQSNGQTRYECGSDLVGHEYCLNPCKNGEFYCNRDRLCKTDDKKCNSDNDCGNWHDEDDCTIRTKHSEDDVKKNTVLKVDGKSSTFFGDVHIYNRPICQEKLRGMEFARVFCETMGFKDAFSIFHLNSAFGTAETNYIMSEVECKGSETYFGSCPHKTRHNCKQYEAVGVSCIDPKSIELKGGESKYEGKVYLIGFPLIATHPDTASSIWTIEEAKVVCTQLFGEEFGRKEEDGVPVFSHEFEEDALETADSCLAVDCKGNETLLTKCNVSFSGECNNIRTAGVKCAKCTPRNLLTLLNGLSMEGKNSDIVDSVNEALLNLKKECRDWVDCHELNPQYREYCLVKSFLQDTLNHLNSSSKGDKINIKTTINHLEMLKNNFLSQKFSEIQLEVETLGEEITSALGEYFGTLAEYDENIANADLDSAYNSWTKSNTLLGDKQHVLGNQLAEIFKYAFEVSAADFHQKAVTMAMAAVSMGNPLSWFVNGADSFLEFESRLNEVMKEANVIAKLAFIKNDFLPKLTTRSESIAQKVSLNAEFFADIMRILNRDDSKPFTREDSDAFLKSYNEFDEAIVKHEVQEYSALLDELIVTSCDIIENPDTSEGAIVALASAKEVCPNARVNSQVISALYDEMLELQTEIMDSLAKVVRAKIAQAGAQNIEETFKKTVSEEIEKTILVTNTMYLLRYHKSILIENACNYLTYMSFGKQPVECDSLLINPNGDVAPLISANQCRMCDCPGVVRENDIFRIPAQLSLGKKQNGTIDLSSLYTINNATETDGVILFKIPGKQWLVDNQWIDSQQNGPIFLEELNLFLPPSSSYDYKLTLNFVVLESEVNGKTYVIDDGVVFVNKYTENSASSCKEPEKNPYNVEPCKSQLGDICVNTKGLITGDLLPGLEKSSWKITLKSSSKLIMPQPDENFYLFARATFCYKGQTKKNPKKKTKDFLPGHENCCLDENMFYNHITRQCSKCANASEPRLYDYYCEKCPRGYEKSPHMFGCKACASGYFKAEDGPGECKQCPPNTVAPLEGSYSCIPETTSKKAKDEM